MGCTRPSPAELILSAGHHWEFCGGFREYLGRGEQCDNSCSLFTTEHDNDLQIFTPRQFLLVSSVCLPSDLGDSCVCCIGPKSKCWLTPARSIIQNAVCIKVPWKSWLLYYVYTIIYREWQKNTFLFQNKYYSMFIKSRLFHPFIYAQMQFKPSMYINT